jgi:endonuclease III
MRRVRAAVVDHPKAALFELAEAGHASALEQLVACILSIRTRDEVMLPTAQALFARAPSAAALAAMEVSEIDAAIRAVSFHERKAAQIHAIALRALEEWSGRLPCDDATLLSLGGVGPKCANLVLGIACGESRIGVDIHVHRVCNRWGYVATKTPEQTLAALEAKLPARYHVEINAVLVPFGKHICTGRMPRCSACPVEAMCAQVGVDEHR